MPLGIATGGVLLGATGLETGFAIDLTVDAGLAMDFETTLFDSAGLVAAEGFFAKALLNFSAADLIENAAGFFTTDFATGLGVGLGTDFLGGFATTFLTAFLTTGFLATGVFLATGFLATDLAGAAFLVLGLATTFVVFAFLVGLGAGFLAIRRFSSSQRFGSAF